MALFISYSSQDRPAVDALTTALRHGRQEVWFDQQLGGGDSWWQMILNQIRSCDVFIVALSNNWLPSKPCQSELRYAQALNRPVLPVQIGKIDSVRVNPLAALQMIDAQNPSVDAGIQLLSAVHSLQARPHPLPDPMPQEPPVPFAYITQLGNALAASELSPQQQMQLLAELRSRLEEDGDDPSARRDIAQLLRMLRQRHDVTYRTGSEIDQLLTSIESLNSHSTGAWATAKGQLAKAVGATRSAPAQPRATPRAVRAPAPPQRPASVPGAPAVARRKGGVKKRPGLIAAIVVCVVILAAAFIAFQLRHASQTSPSAGGGGGPTVIIDGKNQNVSGSVVCTTAGGYVNIAIGATGIAAVLRDANPPQVNSVTLGNVNGERLEYISSTGQGNAAATKNGNSYKITGTATGWDMANPMQPVHKPFEIDVTCS